MSLAGYAAEKMIFHDLTTGASNDIAVASALARDMVTRYGMSDAIGPVAFEGGVGALYREGRMMIGDRPFSESISAQLDREVGNIMSEALRRAEEVLTKHRKVLDHIAEVLKKVETLEREEFEKILVAFGIQPKKGADAPAVLLAEGTKPV